MPAASLAELLQLERWLEDGFKYGLTVKSVVEPSRIYVSRETDTAISPRIEVKAIVGAVQNHARIFDDHQSSARDAWEGTLELLVVTNRITTDNTPLHHVMMGKLRACFLPIYRQGKNPLPWWNQEYVAVTDIREQGTEDTWTDEKSLDYSKVSFGLLFNINPSAWPSGVDLS